MKTIGFKLDAIWVSIRWPYTPEEIDFSEGRPSGVLFLRGPREAHQYIKRSFGGVVPKATLHMLARFARAPFEPEGG